MPDRHARSQHPVLVTETQASGMIAVVRSLGRAGYPVHAASPDATALGFHSRYAVARAHHPPYRDPGFVPWLRDYVARHGIRAIIPSEGFFVALGEAYDEFAPLMPDARPHDQVRRCLSKVFQMEHFWTAGDPLLAEHLPPGRVARPGAPVELPGPLPLMVKADATLAHDGHTGWVRKVTDQAGLDAALSAGLASHRALLVQSVIPGAKCAVNMWIRDGEVLAESMVLAMHENPHWGGLTTYRRMWWHPAIAADARRRIRSIGWQGIVMVEYKWDERTDEFWFIEINFRYWGYLGMDLLAGKDFPRLQMDGRLGDVATDLGPGRTGYRCRLFYPADAGHLMSLLRDPEVAAGRKFRALVEAVVLTLDFRIGSDYWFPGDRGLYFRAAWRFLSRLGRD